MEEMTALERFREWVETYEGFPSGFTIDWTSAVPNTGILFPTALVEVERARTIRGGCRVVNEYSFLICSERLQETGGGMQLVDTGWVPGFEEWVQEQSVLGLAPTFGNVDTDQEEINALDGQYFPLPGGAYQYFVLVTVTFKKQIGA